MDAAVDSWREPLFDDLLRGIRLQSSVYFRPEFRAPWGIRIAARSTTFHIVSSGHCLLQLKGTTSLSLSAGDFVVVTRRDAHLVRDAASSPVVDIFDLAKRCAPDRNAVFRAGGNGAITRLVCGRMQFESSANPLLAILPPLLHVKGIKDGAVPWLRLTTEHVLSELDRDSPG